MHDWIHSLLLQQGINVSMGRLLSSVVIIAAILIVCIIADRLTKRIVVRTVRAFTRRTSTRWDDALIQHNVFGRLAHLVPAVIVDLTAHLPFPDQTQVVAVIQRLITAYVLIVGVLVIDAVIDAIVTIVNQSSLAVGKPIKSYAQIAKIIFMGIAAILVLAILMNSSPWALLSGIGAMTAIIMLVFKDTILGLVASVQISTNDMVRIGDWIEMDKYGADGDVIDISLTTVKVRNWDNTITTIPTYSLIADSFKNWRGMSQSGGRRIKRSIYIDMNSIRFCSDDELERYRDITALREYVDQKYEELKNYNEEHGLDSSNQVNRRRLTNIGTFRAYVRNYLAKHPKIHTSMTRLVRHLSPGAQGLPLEIYVFTNDTQWGNYEDIQADLFDHLFAVIPSFGLRVFQDPTGRDFQSLQ